MPKGEQHVGGECQVQHFLAGHAEKYTSPATNCLQVLGGERGVGCVLQTERGEQVLTHEQMLELGGLADHVDQRLAMLDHEVVLRCRWRRPTSLDYVREHRC